MKKNIVREGMIRAAAHLFRSRGYEGVGVADLLQASGTPRGSLYFHFPGGKEQIARETVLFARDRVLERLKALRAQRPDPTTYVSAVLNGWAAALLESDFQKGCAVALIALETAQSSGPLLEVARDTFREWNEEIARAAEDWGASPEEARGFASVLQSLIQGAVVLARSSHSIQPFEDAASAALALVPSWLSTIQGQASEAPSLAEESR